MTQLLWSSFLRTLSIIVPISIIGALPKSIISNSLPASSAIGLFVIAIVLSLSLNYWAYSLRKKNEN